MCDSQKDSMSVAVRFDVAVRVFEVENGQHPKRGYYPTRRQETAHLEGVRWQGTRMMKHRRGCACASVLSKRRTETDPKQRHLKEYCLFSFDFPRSTLRECCTSAAAGGCQQMGCADPVTTCHCFCFSFKVVATAAGQSKLRKRADDRANTGHGFLATRNHASSWTEFVFFWDVKKS